VVDWARGSNLTFALTFGLYSFVSILLTIKYYLLL